MRPAFAQPANNDFSKVDAYINETMHNFPIPSLALAIVKDDKIVYLHGYGTANRQGDPATPHTPWLMCSVNKSFTALALQQLAAAGKIKLDAPLQTYLPEFQLADPHAASRITIRHLLEHTSGISTQEGNEPYLYQTKTTFAQVLDRMDSYRPEHQPGERYAYSNVNYVLLDQALARASGQPLPKYVQKNILNPLEMSDSTLADYHTLPKAAAGNLIVFGFPVPYDEADVPVMRRAGYLSSNAEDMAHYVIALSNKGEYQGHSLLPARGTGWYDLDWNWHNDNPKNIPLSYMGGSNSIQTNIQLFVPQKEGAANKTAVQVPTSPWLLWTGILSSLTSLFGLICLALIAIAPNLIYVPWPLPFVDLAWWQFTLIGLPFANLVPAVGVILLAALALRRSAWAGATYWYFLAVGLALLAFNGMLII